MRKILKTQAVARPRKYQQYAWKPFLKLEGKILTDAGLHPGSLAAVELQHDEIAGAQIVIRLHSA